MRLYKSEWIKLMSGSSNNQLVLFIMLTLLTKIVINAMFSDLEPSKIITIIGRL